MSNIDLSKEYRCFVTGEVIPLERVEYLLNEGVPEHMLTSLNGSEKIHKPRKLLFVDDEGTSIFCDRIDETRIYATERFSSAEEEKEEAEEEKIEEIPTYKKPSILTEDEE